MYNTHKRFALFIGRWQPFHNGHKFLIDNALEKGENVCIAIRNTEISEENPYTTEQRAEMIRRVYEDKVGIIVIPDIKSINIGRKAGYEVNRIEPPLPTNELRRMVRDIIGNFKLVYLKCSIQTCEKRDLKGMYKKAKLGEIKEFTGFSAPFEEPEKADLVVDTENQDVEKCVKSVLESLKVERLIDAKEYVRKW